MPIAFFSPGLRAHSLVILLFLLKYADFVVHTCSQMLPIAPSVIAVKIFNDGMLGAVVRCLCACSETAGLESHSLRHPSTMCRSAVPQSIFLFPRFRINVRDNITVDIHGGADVGVPHQLLLGCNRRSCGVQRGAVAVSR